MKYVDLNSQIVGILTALRLFAIRYFLGLMRREASHISPYFCDHLFLSLQN